MSAAEGEHGLLQIGAGAVRVEIRVDPESEELRFTECRGKPGWGKEGAEVSECAGGSRDRDAVVSGAVTGNGAEERWRTIPARFRIPAVLGTVT